MTRIGVLSDTHLPASGEAWAFLAGLTETHFENVDMIMHAGDLVAPELLTVFGERPVHAVRGNMDPASASIPVKKIVGIGGFRIGMMHGWGPSAGLEQRLLAEFAADRVDCLVYGHSHRPTCCRVGDVLMFNPGSATDRRRMPYHTVGILEIDSRIDGTIIRID